MQLLPCFALAALLFAPGIATAADTDTARAHAKEKTQEALRAYGQALEEELRQLDGWAKTLGPPGGDKLRDERAVAEEKIRQLTEEADRMWESLRTRMDAVVDDLKRRHQEARAAR